MNDIYFNLIIIVIIIVLFLAYILIAYFYNNYKENKENVYDNLKRTTKYINNTNVTLSSNITSSINKTDNVKLELNSKINTNLITTDAKIITTNSNITNLNNQFIIDSNNLNKYDLNLKNFIQFKDGTNVINEALFNHIFDTTATPNLSLNMMTNITAVSGITVKTATDGNAMRICDNNITSSNCIDMNIDTNGNFNIYPSAITDNNVNNISIFNKNKAKVLARFDLASNGIYLGGDNETAGIFINDSNVYVKNVNFLNSDAKFADVKQSFDKNSFNPLQPYNNYTYNIDDIINFNNLYKNYSTSITGIYTIVKDTPDNTLIINFKTPRFGSVTNKQIKIPIYELTNTDTNVILTNIEPSSEFIPTVQLNINIISIKVTKEANANIRLKFTSPKLTIADTYIEQNITNTFTAFFY